MLYIPLMCQPIEADTPEEAARIFSEAVIKQVINGSLKISVVPSGDLACQSYPVVCDTALNHNEVFKCYVQGKQ